MRALLLFACALEVSAAHLTGVVKTSGTAPRELVATVSGVRVACTVRDGRFDCDLPPGKHDVRLEADRFAPLYLWDVITPAKIDDWNLVRGGSIAGWTNGSTVRIAPVTFGSVTDDVRLRTITVQPNARGFFQATGIPDGAWIAIAESRGSSPSRAVSVDVAGEHEVVLRERLDVRPFASVELMIVPPVDGAGQPWHVELARRDPVSHALAPPRSGPASPAGSWTAHGIEAGEYVVSIASGSTRFHRGEFEVTGDDRPHVVTIDAVPVRGRLRMGRSAIAAQLKFSNWNGEQATAVSAEDGEFTTLLPAAGKWQVDVRLASGQQVRARSLEIRRRDGDAAARSDIDLPAGRIKGRVLDEQGNPATAGVVITRKGSPLADLLAHDGTFELAGIEPGSATIEAQAKDKWSGPVDVEIGEDTRDVELVVRGLRKIAGWLTTANGNPIAGAAIRYLTGTSTFAGEATSSPTGRFELVVAPSTAILDLAIVAPSFGSKLVQVATPRDAARLDLVIGGPTGRLLIRTAEDMPPWPSIGHGGAWMPLVALLERAFGGAAPPWLTPDGIAVDLEPGEYTICSPSHRTACVTQLVAAGTSSMITVPSEGR